MILGNGTVTTSLIRHLGETAPQLTLWWHSFLSHALSRTFEVVFLVSVSNYRFVQECIHSKCNNDVTVRGGQGERVYLCRTQQRWHEFPPTLVTETWPSSSEAELARSPSPKHLPKPRVSNSAPPTIHRWRRRICQFNTAGCCSTHCRIPFSAPLFINWKACTGSHLHLLGMCLSPFEVTNFSTEASLK